MSQEILFLTLAEVTEMHTRLLEQFGGQAGIRDLGLLQSALAMPAQQFGGEYLHPDPASMAAAYLFHLCRNHPFLDGNKRIAATVARVFLLANDIAFDPPEDEYCELVLAVARGELDKDAIAQFIRRFLAT